MAIFTAIGAAIAATFFAGSAIAASVISAALAIGVSYAAQALMGGTNKSDGAKTDNFSAQGQLQSGGGVPRSFQLGYSVTAGSLVYANEWGTIGSTPNAYHTQVIALQDLPGGSLVEVWVNGELCTLGPVAHPSFGFPVTQYYRGDEKSGPIDHLWIKFYDGTQTVADPFLVGTVSSSERPYQSTRVGTGVAYVICTALVDDKLFTGFPSYKFALSGIPLYDISKDSTAGGSGSHRWSDKSTWGGDGDNLPVVQKYNLLRGITYNGQWLYGLQNMASARLPAANWIAQIAKCRATIQGETGLEPTYRSGGQISVDSQSANAIEALLTACHGRPTEVGGVYKVHVGVPDSPAASFTDGDILSTEEQSFKPFFALADSINGIAAKYPLPAEGWNTKVAPPIYRTDLEAIDGNRRLLANPSFDFVPYSAQVQRLMSSALEEAQRARTHVLTLPPAYWILEPGDIVSWSSARNGYVNKLFRVDGVIDRANLDVGLSITEVDPSDYDWNHAVDFEPVTSGPTVIARPAPQDIKDWFAVGEIIKDTDGLSRRPAIRLSWDNQMPGVSGVEYSVRLKSDGSYVTGGNTLDMSRSSILISQSLLPNTQYEVRGRYIPSSPRDMLWSDWLPVTTPNVLVSLVEFNAGIADRVTTAFDQIADLQAKFKNLSSQLAAANTARNWLDKQTTRRELASVSGAANARITEVFTVATNLEAALAQTELTLEANIGDANSRIDNTNLVLSDLSQSVAQQTQSFNSQFGDVNGRISTEIQTRSNETGGLSLRIDQLSSQTNQSFANVNQQFLAQADQNSSFAGQINSLSSQTNQKFASVDQKFLAQTDQNNSFAGQLSNFNTTLNGNTSTLNILASSVNGSSVYLGFLATIDGVTGGLVLTGVSVNGQVSYAFLVRGDLIVDGSITASKIAAGQITAIHIAAGAIDATKIAAESISTRELAVNGVTIEKLVQGAATNIISIPVPNSVSSGVANLPITTPAFGGITVTTTSGKILCIYSGNVGSGTSANATLTLLVDGSPVANFTFGGGSASGTWQWCVSGLSNGSHTATWTVTGITTATRGGGQATVFELRK